MNFSQMPEPVEPPENWEHRSLWRAVQSAILALPNYFKSDLFISGVPATDLFTFNTSLSAAIESQVVEALNGLRSIWDPQSRYALSRFVRQPQNFPDVVLRNINAGGQSQVIMGIELKGWYILAKEREPSFRYKVTPAVCAPHDLLVVVPWALSNVIAGSPRLFEPYIIGARYAAEYRNWHWQYVKADKGSTGIRLSDVTTYYPTKADKISDDAISDKGKNFGRFARTGLMNSYIADLFKETMSGIPITAWQQFLKIFSEGRTEEAIQHELSRISNEYAGLMPLSNEVIDAIRVLTVEIVESLRNQ